MSPTARRRVDGEQANVWSVVALGQRHDADGWIPEHHCRQVGGEQRSLELVPRRGVRDRPPAQLRDRVEIGLAEAVGTGHVARIRIAPGPGMVESSLSCARARSRFCFGRVVR